MISSQMLIFIFYFFWNTCISSKKCKRHPDMANDVSVVGQACVDFKLCKKERTFRFLALSLPLAFSVYFNKLSLILSFIFMHSVSLFVCPFCSDSLKCAHM